MEDKSHGSPFDPVKDAAARNNSLKDSGAVKAYFTPCNSSWGDTKARISTERVSYGFYAPLLPAGSASGLLNKTAPNDCHSRALPAMPKGAHHCDAFSPMKHPQEAEQVDALRAKSGLQNLSCGYTDRLGPAPGCDPMELDAQFSPKCTDTHENATNVNSVVCGPAVSTEAVRDESMSLAKSLDSLPANCNQHSAGSSVEVSGYSSPSSSVFDPDQVRSGLPDLSRDISATWSPSASEPEDTSIQAVPRVSNQGRRYSKYGSKPGSTEEVRAFRSIGPRDAAIKKVKKEIQQAFLQGGIEWDTWAHKCSTFRRTLDILTGNLCSTLQKRGMWDPKTLDSLDFKLWKEKCDEDYERERYARDVRKNRVQEDGSSLTEPRGPDSNGLYAVLAASRVLEDCTIETRESRTPWSRLFPKDLSSIPQRSPRTRLRPRFRRTTKGDEQKSGDTAVSAESS